MMWELELSAAFMMGERNVASRAMPSKRHLGWKTKDIVQECGVNGEGDKGFVGLW